MSNFALNGISGDIKGGMLDGKMLFNNENAWIQDATGNATFCKINSTNQLQIQGVANGWGSGDYDSRIALDSIQVPKQFQDISWSLNSSSTTKVYGYDESNLGTNDSIPFMDTASISYDPKTFIISFSNYSNHFRIQSVSNIVNILLDKK